MLGEALRFGVEATRSGSAPMPAGHRVFSPETFVGRVGGDALAPLAAAGDFACADPNEPATHGRIVEVRADGPGSATRVRQMAVESGRSV